jgi:dTDP-4-dehydrorhamnose reductase
MTKKKLLITGSNGMTGQKLVYQCLERDDIELIATSIGPNRLSKQEGYQYIPMDITQREEVLRIVDQIKPDAIINPAAMTNVDACEKDKETCKKLNIDAVEYLVEAANSCNAHLIHLSTDFIFNGENGPYEEEDEADPVSYYGWSKLEAERIVREKAKDWAILRTILVVGVVEQKTRSNIILWVKGALEKGEKINVVTDQYRMPTLAEDLATACLLTFDKHAQGIFHISGKDFLSTYEIAERVADYFKLDKSLMNPLTSEALSQPAKRPPVTGFKLEKAYRELNYQPHSFEEILTLIDQQLKEREL